MKRQPVRPPTHLARGTLSGLVAFEMQLDRWTRDLKDHTHFAEFFGANAKTRDDVAVSEDLRLAAAMIRENLIRATAHCDRIIAAAEHASERASKFILNPNWEALCRSPKTSSTPPETPSDSPSPSAPKPTPSATP